MSTRMFAFLCLCAVSMALWVCMFYFGILAVALTVSIGCVVFYLGVMLGLAHRVQVVPVPVPVLEPVVPFKVYPKNVVLFPREYKRH